MVPEGAVVVTGGEAEVDWPLGRAEAESRVLTQHPEGTRYMVASREGSAGLLDNHKVPFQPQDSINYYL